MERVIGIDLGTSNSCVAVMEGDNAIVIPDSEGNRTQASIVSFFPDGRHVVGNEAREQMVYNPTNTVYSSKRLIGRPFSASECQTFRELAPYKIVEGPNSSVLIEILGQQYTLVDIASRILRRMKNIAEEYLDEKVTKAVITVPANFNDGQRNATKQAGDAAGLQVLKIINEPTAGALAYGFGQSFEQRIAVYDFGGGTFDITILQITDDVFEVVSTAGNTFLGGDDIDNLIVKMVVNSYRKNYNIDLRQDSIALLRIRHEAEKAKRTLSSEEMARIQILSLIPTDEGIIDLNVSLSRQNFNHIANGLIQNSFVICDEAMKLARAHVSEIENVILVGGTTHIPVLRDMVETYFGRKPYWGVNPDEVVALGAAIQGSILVNAGANSKNAGGDAILLDVTSLSLGITTIGGQIESIIERNTPIPVERSRMFTTSRDYQEFVRIRVFQGESKREEENELIGILELTDLNPNALRGEAKIEVTFEIDANGIVQVQALDMVTGRATSAQIDLYGSTENIPNEIEEEAAAPALLNEDIGSPAAIIIDKN